MVRAKNGLRGVGSHARDEELPLLLLLLLLLLPPPPLLWSHARDEELPRAEDKDEHHAPRRRLGLGLGFGLEVGLGLGLGPELASSLILT